MHHSAIDSSTISVVLRFAQSVMVAYIPRTFHSVPAYYTRSTTTVRECFIDAYCTLLITITSLVHRLSKASTHLATPV